jgi:type I restriction enzyme M protein
LRQEGLDAATYKDYIFGLLFLKRCSDVFRHEWGAIVDRKVAWGMVREEAETQYGENPDYYDTFFVPERARWPHLQQKLNDATEPFGHVLDKALGALTEANESLGSAYEFLINMFAESAGKKGGDFYTPRDVIRLMVRMLNPRPGMSVYDPTCGSGGMLIISREYIEQSGGDPTNLRLCGQVNDASAWSICKLNMLLHGTP